MLGMDHHGTLNCEGSKCSMQTTQSGNTVTQTGDLDSIEVDPYGYSAENYSNNKLFKETGSGATSLFACASSLLTLAFLLL